jgi:hypothetical protein
LIRSVAVVLLVSVLMGCASRGAVDRSVGLPAENESLIVIGIAPSNSNVLFFPGAIKNGVFAQNKFKGSPLFGFPADGYLVGKVPAGQTLGLTTVAVAPYEGTLVFSKLFNPCGEAKTLVLNVPRGKVMYLGHWFYDFQQDRLLVRHGNDIERAREHLANNYPALAPALEYSPAEIMGTSKECTKETIVIPIYIPALK